MHEPAPFFLLQVHSLTYPVGFTARAPADDRTETAVTVATVKSASCKTLSRKPTFLGMKSLATIFLLFATCIALAGTIALIDRARAALVVPASVGAAR